MTTEHYDETYRKNIRNYLIARALAVQVDTKGNHMSLAVLSEDFYVEFLNILLDLNLRNENDTEQNIAGIDLLDRDHRVAIQVSVTCAPQSIRKKIQGSIDKFDKPDDSPWQFYFVPIAEKSPDLTKSFRVPEGLTFNIQKDVLDISRIMNLAKGIDKLKKLSELVDKYGKAKQQIAPRYIHYTQPKEPIHYLVPSEIHEAGKDKLDNLIVEHVSWIVGEHGMGKTSFMRYLINKEIGNPTTGKSIVWVDYSEDLVNSLCYSLKGDDLAIKDIDREDCIVFIDNADESIMPDP